MLATVGVVVSFTDSNGEVWTTNGAVDQNDDDDFSSGPGTLRSRQLRVTVRAATLPGIAEGDTLTVNCVDREVMQVRLIEDGVLAEVYCKTT